MRMRSPSSTSAIAPPSAASGETWPIEGPSAAGEAAVGDQRAGLAQALPFRKTSGRASPACRGRPWALVADHDDVALLDLVAPGSRRRPPPAIERRAPDPRTSRSTRRRPPSSRCSRSRDVAVQHREAAVLAVGVLEVADAAVCGVGVERRSSTCPARRRWRTRRPERRGQLAASSDGEPRGRPSARASPRWSSRGRCARRGAAARRGRARRGCWGCRRRGARPPRGMRERAARPCTGTARAATAVDVRHGEVEPASCAMARRWSTVLVEPPMAMSSAIAFSKASHVGDVRGSTRLVVRRRSAWPAPRCVPAASKSSQRAAWVASRCRCPAGPGRAPRSGSSCCWR